MLIMDRQPFCFSLGQSSKAFYFPSQIRCVYKQKKEHILLICSSNSFEPKAGLEPATYSLRMNCSTN